MNLHIWIHLYPCSVEWITLIMIQILLMRIDKGVVFVSGKTFDPHGEANNYIRLSYCNTSVDKINQGVPLVASAIKEVLEAN